jgi:hypothetical protein
MPKVPRVPRVMLTLAYSAIVKTLGTFNFSSLQTLAHSKLLTVKES